MDKDLSFILDGTSIYTDFCLIRDEIPIFFTCKDESEKYYVVLCVDMDLPRYNIVKVTTTQLNNMLQGILSMRKIFTNQKNYWEVTPVDDEIENDLVDLKPIADIDVNDLPDDDAYFELFNDELKVYAKSINRKILEGEFSYSPVETYEIANDTTENSRITISINLSRISFTVEARDKTEFKKDLVFQHIVLPEYKKEESCLIEGMNCSIKSQDIVKNKILVKNITEDSSPEAA